MAQDVFVKLWKNRHELSAVRSIDNYLFIIARNTMISRIRARLREPGFISGQEKEDEHGRPDRLLEDKETLAILMEGIALLPAKRQEVFRMSRLDGLSNVAIAQQLGMNKDTVKQYLAKALVFLKAHMKERMKTSGIVAFWLSQFFIKIFTSLLPFLFIQRL